VFLARTDNTSAVGWLHKASIDDKKDLPLHMAVRKCAEILLQADCCLYSQPIPGKYNVIADTLSRQFDLTHDNLTSFILSNYNFQAPPSFKISPLPQEILSWVTLWLWKCRETMGSQKAQKTRNRELGEDGLNTRSVSILSTISGYKDLPLTTEQCCLAHSLQLSDVANSQNLIRQSWQQEQSK
jgi:hypothetical protein